MKCCVGQHLPFGSWDTKGFSKIYRDSDLAQYLPVLLSSSYLKTDLDGCAVIPIESVSEVRPLFCLPLNLRASLDPAQLCRTSICPLVPKRIWTGSHQEDFRLILHPGGKADGSEEKLLEPTL